MDAQLGRSHRSNQTSCPLYKLLTTDLGGEKRFASAVARRLQSLGALTRGDRRAASGVDLSDSNLDTPQGRRALRRMYDAIVQETGALPLGVSWNDVQAARGGGDDATTSTSERRISLVATGEEVKEFHAALRDCCSLMGVGIGDSNRVDELYGAGGGDGNKDLGDVKRFLNRILGEWWCLSTRFSVIPLAWMNHTCGCATSTSSLFTLLRIVQRVKSLVQPGT